ncbi:MAG: fibronectin type III domain-containing protein, partial [Patescibacteria group bacterium]|nr:fibronectin type III domain-containing protein [Patescibacteria group bacterium]
YRVSALGVGGVSGTSSGTASATTLPSAPTQVTATAQAGLKINVSWQPPTGSGVITGYKIERSTDGGTSWSTPVVLGTSTTYQDSGLSAGTTYYYRVAAMNAGDTSSYSAESNGVVGGDVPSTVTSPTVTVLSGGVMTLLWTSPASNGYPVTSYSVDKSASGGSFNTIATITGNPPTTTYTATGLTNNTSYQWRIEATNTLGTSSAGASSSPVTALPPLRIEAQTISGTLIAGAKYTINPDPNGVPATLTDGGSEDADNTADGITTVNLVPFGTYNITMSTIPSGYGILGNWILYTEDSASLNGVIKFRLVSVTTNISQLGTTVITTPPTLKDTTLHNWSSSFHALKINKTASAINTASQLPPIISAGSNNSNAIIDAISNQATIQLNTTFSPTTSSQNIINTLQVPTYSMPNDKNVISVIPSIVTANSVTNGQIISTPPLNKIIPGQPMVIPVQSSALPNTGGVKQLFVQSSPSSSSSGSPGSDWFVIRSNQTIPSDLPSLPSTVNKSSTLFVNVTYPYEGSGNGFNWNNPSNFAHAPNMTVTLPMPSVGSNMQTYTDGCVVPAVFLFDVSTKSWITNQVTILSESQDPQISNVCDYVIQVPHFSQFGIGGQINQAHGGADVRIFTTPPSLTSATISPLVSSMSSGEFGGALPLHDNVTETVKVGEHISASIDINDPMGATFVEHVGLHTNFDGPYDQNGQTYIMYEPGQPLAVFDLQHFLSNANVTASTSGNDLIVTFDLTFAKPMDTSDITIRSWDQNKVAFNDVFHRALQVVTSLPLASSITSYTTLPNELASNIQTKNMLINSIENNTTVATPLVEPTILLSGNGNFTYNGQEYIPFGFSTSCQTASGYCTDSWMYIGGSRTSANAILYSNTDKSPMISFYSQQLECDGYDMSHFLSGSKNKVVFECTKPLGSGISDYTILPH